MPSRADTRAIVEAALRAAGIGALVWMLWLTLDRDSGNPSASARSATLMASLERWSGGASYPRHIAVRVDSTPSAAVRDWLRAVRLAGSIVNWNGDLAPIAVSAAPAATPGGGLHVTVAAPAGRTITLADDVGPIDTATASGGGVRFSVAAAAGAIVVRSDGSVARTTSADSARIKRVLVLGNAGWETKFVVAALEESGWDVDAVMRIAPGVAITQGGGSLLDSSRHGAVVAIDESAAERASDIARFVANGGGLVLAARAAASPGFDRLRAGTIARSAVHPATNDASAPRTFASLAHMPITTLHRDAVVRESRPAGVVAAARRHVAGRVLQLGHLDTWLWRMRGGDESPGEHRDWWTRAVASVARVDYRHVGGTAGEGAPYPRLVEALGPPSELKQSLAMAPGRISLWAPFLLLVFALLTEWVSRRTRGLR